MSQTQLNHCRFSHHHLADASLNHFVPNEKRQNLSANRCRIVCLVYSRKKKSVFFKFHCNCACVGGAV